MRNEFYGDKRDLVKWGSLLHLAELHNIRLILFAAYLRPDRTALHLNVSQNRTHKLVPLPEAVWRHFRNIHDIHDLGRAAGITIDIFDDLFQDRQDYTRRLIKWIQNHPNRKMAFLDPDTGLAPHHPDLKHVNPDEIAHIHAALEPGDVVVLYQHARRTKTWLEDTRSEFARAVDADPDSIVTIHSPNVNDVAFFATTKPS
jgi:hypothetical protein